MAIISNPIITVSPSVVSAAVNGTTTATPKTSTKTEAQKATDNYNQFLTLLTTQLQHQDPTAPLDTNQFTQQLVQFSQVEQQLKGNAKLDAIIANTGSTSQISSLLGYVGLNATINSAQGVLKNGSATWTVSAPSSADNADVSISDANGRKIASYKQSLRAGDQKITWDGLDSNGNQVADGIYSIAVAGVNSAGTSFTATSKISTQISGIDSSSGSATLIAGGLSFKPEQVVAVSR
jgi:flagellar basal-body rod modification protein FlgD